jgi:hypothetical protein
MGVGGQLHAPAALPPVPIVDEAGWAPGPIWTAAKNLATTAVAARNVTNTSPRLTVTARTAGATKLTTTTTTSSSSSAVTI